MRLFILFLFILFISLNSYAICAINPVDAKSFNANYFVNDFGVVSGIFEFTFDYSRDCMIDYSVDRLNIINQTGVSELEMIIEIQNNDFSCPTNFKEMFYKNLSEDFLNLHCFAAFNKEDELFLVLFGEVSIEKDKSENLTLFFGGWDFLEFIEKSSFKITRVGYSRFLDFSNKEEAILIGNTIYFLSAPKEKVVVAIELFNIEEEFNSKLFPIIFIVFFLVLFSVVFSLFFVWKKMPKKSDKKEELNRIRLKLKNLESSFMKGQIDENTYRRLAEQYNLQVNDLISDLKKMDEKKLLNIFNKK